MKQHPLAYLASSAKNNKLFALNIRISGKGGNAQILKRYYFDFFFS